MAKIKPTQKITTEKNPEVIFETFTKEGYAFLNLSNTPIYQTSVKRDVVCDTYNIEKYPNCRYILLNGQRYYFMADISALLEGNPHFLHNHCLCKHGVVQPSEIVVVKDRAMIEELSKAKNRRPLTFGTENWVKMKTLRSLDIRRWQAKDKTLIPEAERLIYSGILGKDISTAPDYQSLILPEYRRKKDSPGRAKGRKKEGEKKPPLYLIKRIEGVKAHLGTLKNERDSLLRMKDCLRQIQAEAEKIHQEQRNGGGRFDTPVEVLLPADMSDSEMESLFWLIHRMEKSESKGRLTLNGFEKKGIVRKRFSIPPWLIPKLSLLDSQIEERITPLLLEIDTYEKGISEYEKGVKRILAGEKWTPGGLLKAPELKKEDKWTEKSRRTQEK